jgi:ferredoxin-type protein NapH
LIFGRIYCGYVCPMNTLMIPVEWLSAKLKIQTMNTPKWLQSGYFSWVFLFVSIAAMLISKRLLRIDLPILLLWVIIAVLVALRYRPVVFHNLICPFGALQKTFGQFAKFSVKVDPKGCVGCKLCEKVCPSDSIVVSSDDKKALINTRLCLQCTNCRQVCPKNTIRYSRQKSL